MKPDHVALREKRNRGWPWPEDSSGRTPMYGEDGWCRACGVPQRPQTGSMVFQRRGLTVAGAWVPNWRFDTICLERDLADEVASRFTVELREVQWARSSPGEAMQIVIPSTTTRWFDDQAMRDAASRWGRDPGARCGVCGVWRWAPLWWGSLPGMVDPSVVAGYDIVAGPEWFGSGWVADRRILVRRALAELLVAASPRDFTIQEVVEVTGVDGSTPPWSYTPGPPVPAGAVSEVFTATLLAESAVHGGPSASARRAAVAARELLVSSGGLVSADALTIAAQKFFDGGEVEEALSLWRQAAAHGSAAAREALRRYDANS